MKEKIKENKGLTLLSLILTILLLIILAGITIFLTVGENGVVDKAKQIAKGTEEEIIRENIKIDLLEVKRNTNGIISINDLNKILDKYDVTFDSDSFKGIIKDDENNQIDLSDIIDEFNIYGGTYNNNSVLYCWDFEQSLASYRDDFYDMLDELKITSVYFCFDPTNFTTHKEETKKFISDLNQRKISVLALSGDPSWSYTNENAKNNFLAPILSYNKSVKSNEKIIGVVLDTEPAGTTRWQQNESNALKDYVDTQIELYKYVKSNNLLCIQCIARWFDEVNTTALEDLVENGCDGISVMNYWKSAMVGSIATEMNYAKKHNKFIDSIAEFGEPNEGDGGENVTFYNDGIDVAKVKYKEVKDTYNYNRLGMAYHDYTALNKIFGKQYIIEIYVNKGDEKLPNTKIKVVNVKRETVDIHEATTTAGGYAVFWLEYGKYYRVEIEGYGVAGITPDFSQKQFSFLNNDGDYFAIDAYAYEETPVTTYNAEIYFKDESNNLVTNKAVTITNANDSSDKFEGTITSGGYISTWLKHGVTYRVQVDGYSQTSTFKYDSDIGNYKAFDVICR